MFQPGTIMLVKNLKTNEQFLMEFVEEKQGADLRGDQKIYETILVGKTIPEKETKEFSNTEYIWADALAVIIHYDSVLSEIEELVSPQ